MGTIRTFKIGLGIYRITQEGSMGLIQENKYAFDLIWIKWLRVAFGLRRVWAGGNIPVWFCWRTGVEHAELFNHKKHAVYDSKTGKFIRFSWLPYFPYNYWKYEALLKRYSKSFRRHYIGIMYGVQR